MTDNCQRCGEGPDPDLRTLWMKCLYAMNELKVPFEQAAIFGHYREKIGDRLTGFGPISDFAPVRSDRKPRNYPFFTMRVCKDCRADWMLAIQDWFFEKPERSEVGSGIFVRREGRSVEITQEEWDELQRASLEENDG